MKKATLLAGACWALQVTTSAQFVEHPIERCDSHEPFCVRAGDMDMDGDLDVVAMSAKDDKLIWYENDGSGSFGAVHSIHRSSEDQNDRFMQFELADMDGDMDLDVVAYWEQYPAGLALHRNLGDGSFAAPETIGITDVFYYDYYSLTVADINGDGSPDVIAGDDSSTKLYVNDGNGSFSWLAFPNSPSHPVSLRAGDVDNDGDQDILYVSNNTANWRFNDGTGSFTPSAMVGLSLGGSRAQAHCDDLDGDGFLDVAYVALGVLQWKPNDGTGHFQFGQGTFIAPQVDQVSYLNTADLDADGDADILTSNYATDEIAWYANDGSGVFSDAQVLTNTCQGASSFDTADLDGDGDVDVVAAAKIGAFIGWLSNAGDGTFGPLVELDHALNIPVSTASGDVDSDGDTDLGVASSFDAKLAWYPIVTTGVFGEQQVINSGNTKGAGSIFADLDSDGDLDVLAAWTDLDSWADSANYQGLGWYANDGSGSFGPLQSILDPGQGPTGTDAVDLDGDGDVDLVGFWPDRIAALINEGSGTFIANDPTMVVGAVFTGHTMGDLDGDGDPDIVTIIRSNPNVYLLHWFANEGAGTFAPEVLIDPVAPERLFKPGLADMDGDGDLDIVGMREMVDDFTDRVTLYLNDGSGAFGPPIEQPITEHFEHLVPADIDGDGDMDVVLGLRVITSGFPNYGRLIWRANDGMGTLGPEQMIADSTGFISTVACLDIDADGALDIIAGGESSCWLSWFKNPDVSTATATDLATGPALLVAPSPAHDETRLTASAPLTTDHRITVTDALGRVVLRLRGEGSRSLNIPVDPLAAGTYIVRVTDPNGTQASARLVVE
jgi:hypothetical protein